MTEDTSNDQLLFQVIFGAIAFLTTNIIFLLIGTYGIWYGITTNYPPITILSAFIYVLIFYHNYKLLKNTQNKLQEHQENA